MPSIIGDLDSILKAQQAKMKELPDMQMPYRAAQADLPGLPPPFTLRGDILRTADKLTHGDRNAAYGDPVDNYRHTASITNSILGTKLTAHEMALAMVAVKLARLAKNPGHKDSYIDAAAYLGIAYECAVARDDALADD